VKKQELKLQMQINFPLFCCIKVIIFDFYTAPFKPKSSSDFGFWKMKLLQSLF